MGRLVETERGVHEVHDSLKSAFMCVCSSGQVEGGTPSKSVYGVKSGENWELSPDSQVAHTPSQRTDATLLGY